MIFLKLTLTQNLEMFRIMLVVIFECKMLVRKLERFLRKYLVVQLTQLKDAPVMRAHGESRKSSMRPL